MSLVAVCLAAEARGYHLLVDELAGWHLDGDHLVGDRAVQAAGDTPRLKREATGTAADSDFAADVAYLKRTPANVDVAFDVGALAQEVEDASFIRLHNFRNPVEAIRHHQSDLILAVGAFHLDSGNVRCTDEVDLSIDGLFVRLGHVLLP